MEISKPQDSLSPTSTRVMHDGVRAHVAGKIELALQSLFAEIPKEAGLSASQIYESLVEPPNPEMGDLAFGTFALAKLLRSGPPQISARLQEAIGTDEVIESVRATGAYLNFVVSMKALGQQAVAPAQSGALFQKKLTQNTPRMMIEYSQPNTHKELHVGHMRNLCLGYAVASLLEYAGYDKVTATFPGDVGTHVAKCLWYMKFHNSEPEPLENKGEWLGRMYSKGHLKLEDDLGTPQDAKNREQLTAILKQLEAKQGEFFDLWEKTRGWSIDLMNKVYAWAGVSFDYWYWESDVDSASVKLAKKLFAEGRLIQSEGAIGMDLESYEGGKGLGFMMLLKSDGTGLYATKDIELACRKFQEVKIQKSLYVVDIRQALHFRQVFKALEILGLAKSGDCFHLQYNFVELPDGAMSSRKGNIIPLLDLIERMERMVKEQYLARYKDEWSTKEIDEVASQVAQGAIKYGMTRMDTNKKIVFDMAEWLKLDGESGPFIQYSHARIASLIRKLGYDAKANVDWSVLKEKSERRLAQFALGFNRVAVDAAENYKPASICAYLYDCAKAFNVFYHDCPIGAAETPELKNARLALAAATGAVLAQGLKLLGIPAPARM